MATGIRTSRDYERPMPLYNRLSQRDDPTNRQLFCVSRSFASRMHALTMPTSRKMGRRTSQRFFCGPGRLTELLLVSFYMSGMMDE